jgi:anti-anti-sigma regulatory factor
MFFGIESLSETALRAANKKFNKVSEYEESIKKIHDHGIMINGGFIFGFDTDDEGVFERTVEFVLKNRITLPTYHVLTPMPGTKLFYQLKTEGRIFDYDWSKYNSGNVVFYPKLMPPETLQEGYFWAFHETYKYSSIATRVLHPQQRLFQRLGLNQGYRRIVRRSPNGSVPRFSEIFNKNPEIIPSREDITSTIVQTAKGVMQTSTKITAFLKIQIRKIASEPNFQFDLQGVLDKFSARKLWRKIRQAINQGAQTVVINFQDVSAITPRAFKILLFKKRMIKRYNKKIKLINIDPRYAEAIRAITGFQVYPREKH